MHICESKIFFLSNSYVHTSKTFNNFGGIQETKFDPRDPRETIPEHFERFDAGIPPLAIIDFLAPCLNKVLLLKHTRSKRSIDA